jgi:hypothetical protein
MFRDLRIPFRMFRGDMQHLRKRQIKEREIKSGLEIIASK